MEEFGIETKIHLPSVGENLRTFSHIYLIHHGNLTNTLEDHVMVPTIAQLKDDCETYDILREPTKLEEQLLL